jgi:hypothetical protein
MNIMNSIKNIFKLIGFLLKFGSGSIKLQNNVNADHKQQRYY